MKQKIYKIYGTLLGRLYASFDKQPPKLRIFSSYRTCILTLFGKGQGQKIYEEDIKRYKRQGLFIPSACYFFDWDFITIHLGELKRSIQDETLKADYGHPITGLLLHELGHSKWKKYRNKRKMKEEDYAEAFAKRWCRKLEREEFFKGLQDK